MPEIRGAFEDVDTLSDASGITARFSRRLKNNELTVSIVKVFTRDGRVEQTSFVPASMWPDYLQMVDKATKRLAELQAEQDKAPPTKKAAHR